MNIIFLTDLSERWLIIQIYDIITFSETFPLYLERLQIDLPKLIQVKMKISIDKCNLCFQELEEIGNVVPGLSLGIVKRKVEAVLIKAMPQTKREIIPFLGFSIYYRRNLKEFATLSERLYRICDQNTVFEMTQERITAYERKLITPWKMLLYSLCKLENAFQTPR
ncbi:hypothetical protein O181_089272 [Austropuccinia psidii MF-1]|uniref:Uncharacterized protein n=1 Tax=Austropuccinia psidii MF-1 TaxID=1389203 RepID=A0A9Q3IT99_9BASI|nr:hypothetical protein [Austropuccinia psidii MF-1]